MTPIMVAALLMAQVPPDQCAADRTSPADRQTLTAAMRANAPLDQAIIERIRGHVLACAGSAASTDVAEATLARIIGAELQTMLNAAGIDMRIVDRWFDAQDASFRTDPNVTPEEGAAMAEGLVRAGIPIQAVERHGLMIGNYLGTRIAMERARRGMSVRN